MNRLRLLCAISVLLLTACQQLSRPLNLTAESAEENLVVNGEFDEGLGGWLTILNAGDFSAAVVTDQGLSGSNALLATIADGGDEPFSLGVRQFLPETSQAVANEPYVVSFQAKADAERSIVVQVIVAGNSYLYQEVQLSTDAQAFQLEVTPEEAGSIELLFLLGADGNNVALDSVAFVAGEVLPPTPADGEVITNGEFDDGLNSWVPFENSGSLSTQVVTNQNISGQNALEALITTPGPDVFSVGVLQAIAFPSKADHSYTLSFQAKAASPREITVQYKIGEESKFFVPISLTEEVQEFRFAADSKVVGPMELLFFLGVERETVYIDNVSVTEEKILPEPNIPLADISAATDPVAIGGGGYVTGVYYHPTTADLLYMRTDVGGAFRYDYQQRKWISLFTDFTLEDENYFGVNALALAPSDDNYIYVALDKAEYLSGPADVLVSKDKGATWTPTGLNKRFFAFDNFYNKVMGPALAVDPTNAERVYAGTINDGLWFKDGSAEWVRLEGVPNGTANKGVKNIVFAPNGDLVVGVPDVGIFVRSADAKAFVRLEGAPTDIYNLSFNSRNHLYVATGEGIYLYKDGVWTSQFTDVSFADVAVHPAFDNKVVAAETRFGGGRGGLYLSRDGGATWKIVDPLSGLNKDYVRRKYPRWYPEFFFADTTASITFDPSKADAVTFSDFYTVWNTDNIYRRVSVWDAYARGHEETYITELLSPPRGPRLMAGVADILGFQWSDPSRFPRKTLTTILEPANNGTSLDYCAADPKQKVFAGNIDNKGGQGYVFLSSNDFATWTQRKVPGSMGRVAMSATDCNNLVILTQGETSEVFYSKDAGATWTRSAGAPKNLMDNMFRTRSLLNSDKVEGGTFYLYEHPGRLYASTNGGANFELVSNSLPLNATFDKWEVKARPGVAGEVWVSLDNAGLHRSTNGGRTFEKITGIKRSFTFGFGRGKGRHDPTTVYIYGVINDSEGVFYSEDSGETWTRVNADVNFVNSPRSLTGDMQFYGNVYIGSQGSGILHLALDGARGKGPRR